MPVGLKLNRTILSALLFLTVTAKAGAEQPTAPADKLDRIPDTRYELNGVFQEYISGITEDWILPLPQRNPAVLKMFADRDQPPHRDLLPWSGEFAGKYLTGGTQVFRLTHDPQLKACLAKFVAELVKQQAEDGYLGPFAKNERLQWMWDVWGHYHVMLGLLLWHEETGNPKALECATKIGDRLCQKFLHANKRIVDYGSVEMNHAAFIHCACSTKPPRRRLIWSWRGRLPTTSFKTSGRAITCARRWPAGNFIRGPSRAGKVCIPSRGWRNYTGSPAIKITASPLSKSGGAS